MAVVPAVGGTLAPWAQPQLQCVVTCAGQDSLPRASKFRLTQLSVVHSSKQKLVRPNLTGASECSRVVSSSPCKCRVLFARGRAEPCLVHSKRCPSCEGAAFVCSRVEFVTRAAIPNTARLCHTVEFAILSSLIGSQGSCAFSDWLKTMKWQGLTTWQNLIGLRSGCLQHIELLFFKSTCTPSGVG